jgi:hypothetical protein
MTDVPPCRCDAPNPECHRAGVPMVGGRWELCQTSAIHRALWDARASGKWAAVPDSPPRLPCVHLGPALPFQAGCGCSQRLRDCAEHATASVGPSPCHHWCTDGRGNVVCPEYEPQD